MGSSSSALFWQKEVTDIFMNFHFLAKMDSLGQNLIFLAWKKNFCVGNLEKIFWILKEVTDKFLDFVFWQKEVNDYFASFCQKKVSLTSFCEKIFFRKLSVTSFFNLFLVEVYWQSKDLVFLTTNKHYEKNNETQN